MPELPEVEVVRAGLEPAVTGATVSAVTVFDARSLRRHSGPSEDFVDRLTGRSLTAAIRRGKFLWFPLADSSLKTKEIVDELSVSAPQAPETGDSPSFLAGAESGAWAGADTGEAILVHLGMSGQVLLREAGGEDALTRIRIELEHPEHGPLRLNFVDQRIFGSMVIDDLVPTSDGGPGGFAGDGGSETGRAAVIPSQAAHIARDPIDPFFDDRAFFARLARRGSGIKRALLDQSLISGVGNIYADEALWAARIHYDQPATTLTRARAKTLLAEVRLVLARALAEGGTSFDAQYLNVNGESGYFAHSLRAYGQHGKPCPRCGRPLQRDTFMNRGSHFCPWCQRLRKPSSERLLP